MSQTQKGDAAKDARPRSSQITSPKTADHRGGGGSSATAEGAERAASGRRVADKVPARSSSAEAAAMTEEGAPSRAARRGRGVKAQAAESSEADAVQGGIAASDADAKRRSAKARDRSAEADRSILAGLGAVQAQAGAELRAKSAAAPKDQGSPVDGADKKEEAKRTDPKVTLVDLRKSAQSRRESPKAEAQGDDSLAAKAVEAKSPAGGSGRELVRELTLDSGSQAAQRPRAAGDAASPAPAQADFRAMLAERLQDAWNGEIVQSARIILRDGDSGTIRLRLRPESLGNVKIELNLSDNNISGRIVVESDEAKSAFERNMSELADAFKRGGFESASLQVSVGSGGGSAGGAGGQAAGSSGEGPYYSDRLRAAVDSGAEPSTATAAYRRQGAAVDMLA